MSSIPAAGFLRLHQIIPDKRRGTPGLLPIGATTWWAGIRAGRYPAGVKLAPRVTAWRAEDIRKLVEEVGA